MNAWKPRLGIVSTSRYDGQTCFGIDLVHLRNLQVGHLYVILNNAKCINPEIP